MVTWALGEHLGIWRALGDLEGTQSLGHLGTQGTQALGHSGTQALRHMGARASRHLGTRGTLFSRLHAAMIEKLIDKFPDKSKSIFSKSKT